MYILKIGGSVITDKAKENTYKKVVMDNLAKQIHKAKKRMIIVHGAGSFGHILAKKYDLNSGQKNDGDYIGFSLTHAMVQKLNSLVLDSLHENNISAVSISPHSVLKLKDHNISKFDYKIFDDYLKIGFTPVTFGDVVLDESLGYSICSGDLLVQALAKYFKTEKVIFIIDEDGIYSANPKIDKNAKLIQKTTITELDKLNISMDEHADVTGGMSGKIKTINNISKMGIDTVLLNGNKPDRLYKALRDEKTKSTIVYGDKK